MRTTTVQLLPAATVAPDVQVVLPAPVSTLKTPAVFCPVMAGRLVIVMAPAPGLVTVKVWVTVPPAGVLVGKASVQVVALVNPLMLQFTAPVPTPLVTA